MKYIAFAIMVLSASVAGACNRCGFSSCRFQHHAVVKRVVVPQNVQNISIVNTYPQGDSVYSVGQAAQLYATNPSLAITSASRVAEQATASLTQAIKSGEVTTAQLIELQKLQAVSQALQSVSGSDGPQSLNLRITQSGSGMKVEQVDSGNGNQPPAPATGSVVSQKCGSCHGSQLASPKGGLYLGGAKLPPDKGMRSLEILSGKNVPAAMKTVVEGLSNEDKAALMEEILALWRQE